MANYIAIHIASSLIINSISASEQPVQSSAYRFIRVSDAVLNKYYRLASKNRNGTLVSAGELATVSPAFLELLAVR
ncbi:hypothetical protein PS627_01198 [Pseudomonas fluorescens]|uniref:hypothetical protein n=1 Tax=Pseudomonas fluorescens TaxID=294 RepID=UPI0012537C8B|nr:hypothetical protein [Pseudomonas fluorescens]CAG8865285.1 hypothetical protein PS627_01198 [Pseudomonas fluorescens]